MPHLSGAVGSQPYGTLVALALTVILIGTFGALYTDTRPGPLPREVTLRRSGVRGQGRVTLGLPMGQRVGTATPTWGSDEASLPSRGGRWWGSGF